MGRHSIVAFVVALTLAGVSTAATPQQRPSRATDQQVESLLSRLEAGHRHLPQQLRSGNRSPCHQRHTGRRGHQPHRERPQGGVRSSPGPRARPPGFLRRCRRRAATRVRHRRLHVRQLAGRDGRARLAGTPGRPRSTRRRLRGLGQLGRPAVCEGPRQRSAGEGIAGAHEEGRRAVPQEPRQGPDRSRIDGSREETTSTSSSRTSPRRPTT